MKSLTVAIKEVTEVLRHGSDCEKYKLKKSFGLWALEDDGDFVEYVCNLSPRDRFTKAHSPPLVP